MLLEGLSEPVSGGFGKQHSLWADDSAVGTTTISQSPAKPRPLMDCEAALEQNLRVRPTREILGARVHSDSSEIWGAMLALMRARMAFELRVC
jgi:hypothetical protein